MPTGLLLDRVGPRRTVAGFLVLAAFGAGLLGLAHGFAGAAAAMALIGLGCAPALMGGLYLFGRSYPPERFAMLSSVMIGLGTSGDLLGSTPLALASHAFGWRTILFGLALVTLAAAGLVLWLIADPPQLADPLRTSVWRGFAEVARMRALWPVLPVVFVSYAVVIATRSLWVGSYLGSVHGLDALQRGNGTLAMSAAMAAGAIGYGPLERLVRDPKRTAFAGCLVTGLALSGLGLFGGGSTALAVALLALTGAAGLSYGILMAHARLFFPAHLLGRGVAFMNIVFMGGAAAIQGLSALFVLETGGLSPTRSTAGCSWPTGWRCWRRRRCMPSRRGSRCSSGSRRRAMDRARKNCARAAEMLPSKTRPDLRSGAGACRRLAPEPRTRRGSAVRHRPRSA